MAKGEYVIKLVGQLGEAQTLKDVQSKISSIEKKLKGINIDVKADGVEKLSSSVKKVAMTKQAIAKQEKWSADQASKNIRNEIILNDKLAGSKKAQRTTEYITMQGLIETQKTNLKSLDEELAKSKPRNKQVQLYRKEIEDTNRAMAEQKSRIFVLERGSMSFWDRITAKSKEYFVYAAGAMVTQQAARVIGEMVTQVATLDKSLTELKKVTDLEGESLKQFTKDAYNAASGVAKTGNDMIQASTEFAKSGFTNEESLELGKIALMYTNIADEEISAAQASEFLISNMKAFVKEGLTAIQIIDKVNEVANKFAVSSGDISENIGSISSLMQSAGNSFDQILGMLTAITEVTRDASSAANGLKSITMRLRGLNDEGEKDLELVAKLQKLYGKLGINLMNSSGELKSTYDILSELAPKWKDLDSATQGYIAQQSAGIYQAARFVTLLEQFATAQDAVTTSLDSTGSAARENDKVLDSVEGKLNAFKRAFEQLSTTVVNSDLLKFLISAGTILLKFIQGPLSLFNTTLGKTILVAGAATLAMTLLGKSVVFLGTTAVWKTIVAYIWAMTQGLAGMQLAAVSAGKALLTLLANPVFLTAAAATGLFLAFGRVSQATKDAQKELEKYNDTLGKTSGLSTELDDLQNKLKDQNLSLEEKQEIQDGILDIQKRINDAFGVEGSNIDTNSTKLEGQIDLLKERLKLEEKNAAQQMIDKNKNRKVGDDKSWIGNAIDYLFGGKKTAEEDVDTWIKTQEEIASAYIKTTDEIYNANEKFEKAAANPNLTVEELNSNLEEIYKAISNSDIPEEYKTILQNKYSQIYQDVQTSMSGVFKKQNAKKYIDEYKSSINYLLQQMQQQGLNKEYLLKFLEKDILNDGGFPVLDKMFENLTSDEFNILSPIATAASKAGVPLKEFINILAQVYPEIQTVQDITETSRASFESLNEELDSIQGAYDTVSNALEEYNNNGYFSIDTLEKLLSLEDKYIDALIDENGNIKDNVDVFKTLAEAKLDDIQASEDSRYYNELLKLAQLDEAGAAQLAAGSIDQYNQAQAGTAPNAEKLRAEIEKNIAAFNEMSSAALQAAYDAANARHEQNNAAIGNARTGLSTNYKKSLGGSDSSKKEKEWWEKELDSLKEQFKYNELTIGAYINNLGNLLSKLSQGSDAWRQVNEELQKQRLTKVENDYQRGTISLEQYIAKLKELIKTYKQGTEAWNDLAEKIEKANDELLSNRKDNYDKAHKAALKLIDDEISKIKDLRDATEKRYNDEIDAKKKSNDETDRAIELAKLEENLANARKEKNKRVYKEGVGFVWETDKEAIKDAEEALNEFRQDEEIRQLEEARDAELAILDEKIQNWKDYKDSWSDITSEFEDEQNRQMLLQQMGADFESRILNDRLGALEKFKNEYIGIQQEILAASNASFGSLVPTDNTSGGNSNGSQQKTYTVQSGDTLSGIGAKFGIEWKKIYEANKSIIGSNPNVIRAGQTFTIPGYKDGGIVDYTGLARLHGTPSKPEYVLNNTQMRNLLSNFTRPQVQPNKVGGGGNVINYNFGNIELPNVHNTRQFITELKSLVNITKHQ